MKQTWWSTSPRNVQNVRRSRFGWVVGTVACPYPWHRRPQRLSLTMPVSDRRNPERPNGRMLSTNSYSIHPCCSMSAENIASGETQVILTQARMLLLCKAPDLSTFPRLWNSLFAQKCQLDRLIKGTRKKDGPCTATGTKAGCHQPFN